MKPPFSVVVPARNEAGTVAEVVRRMAGSPGVGEVVVVDNASTDTTANAARLAGARVVHESRPGLGAAVKAGLKAASHDTVVKVDADLTRVEPGLVERLAAAAGEDVALVKGRWRDPVDTMPMTRLMVRPALRHLFPELAGLAAANSGLYMVDRRAVAVDRLRDSYAVDLDILLRVHSGGWSVRETDIGEIRNNPRDIAHYNDISEELLGLLIERAACNPLRPLVVAARRAEEIVSCCLGTMAAKLAAGGRVIVCLPPDCALDRSLLTRAMRPFPTGALATPDTLARRLAAGKLCGVTAVLPSVESAREDPDFERAVLAQLQNASLPRPRCYRMRSLEGADFHPGVTVDIGSHRDLKRFWCAWVAEEKGLDDRAMMRACDEDDRWGEEAGVLAAEGFAPWFSPSGVACLKSL